MKTLMVAARTVRPGLADFALSLGGGDHSRSDQKCVGRQGTENVDLANNS
jgi:hypothetical protein